MTRTKTMIAVALGMAMLFAAAAAEADDGKPNIVWIMAEDISVDLECYGMAGVMTPNLNRLAGEGVRYNNAIATSPICSPNRSAMMVGAHQNAIGAHHHRSNRNRLLPEPYKPFTFWLRQAGYTCVLGNDQVNHFRDGPAMRGGGGSKIDVNFKADAIGDYDGVSRFGLFDKEGAFDVKDQPFFAQITLMVTHRGDWWSSVRRRSQDPVEHEEVELPPYLADHPIVREDWVQYLDQVEYMDREVGIILNQLEELGVADNTIVIFIGDNGRENIRGKGYLYDTGVRVPLIVRWPGKMKPGTVSDELVATTDITASILEAAGVPLPDYLTGRPFLVNGSSREEVVSARDLFDEILDRSRSVTTRDFRYIRNDMPTVPYDAGSAYIELHRPGLHAMRRMKANGELVDPAQLHFLRLVKPVEELYSLVDDPHETNNLANDPAYRHILEDLRARLGRWEANLPKYDESETEIVQPWAPPILQWVRYTNPDLFQEITDGGEVHYGPLIREYRKSRE